QSLFFGWTQQRPLRITEEGSMRRGRPLVSSGAAFPDHQSRYGSGAPHSIPVESRFTADRSELGQESAVTGSAAVDLLDAVAVHVRHRQVVVGPVALRVVHDRG